VQLQKLKLAFSLNSLIQEETLRSSHFNLNTTPISPHRTVIDSITFSHKSFAQILINRRQNPSDVSNRDISQIRLHDLSFISSVVYRMLSTEWRKLK